MTQNNNNFCTQNELSVAQTYFDHKRTTQAQINRIYSNKQKDTANTDTGLQ